MSFPSARSTFALGGVTVLAVVLGAAPALAHVEPTVEQVPAGSSTTVGLTLEHGCDESPTKEVAVQIPDGVDEATPVAPDGWTAQSTADTVTFTADPGSELDAHTSQAFEIELTPSADAVGDVLLLKTVQTCVTGEIGWIEEWDGEGEEPEHPAPQVTVVAAGEEATAGEGDHHAEETTVPEGDHHAEESATTVAEHHAEEDAAASDAQDDQDDSNTGVVLVVLVLAAIGFGGVMLVRSRRSSSAP